MSASASQRALTLGRSPTVALLDVVQRLRAQGDVVLDLSGGEPDFGTPQHVVQAASDALAAGQTHYTASRGITELREQIVGKLRRDNGIHIESVDDVIVTPSAKHGLFIALATVLDAGDEVLVPTPSWVSYGPMAALLGARAVAVPLCAPDHFAITAAALQAAVGPRTKAIVVNTPNNPTGRMLGADEADAIAEVANEFDLAIITDEIYEHIRYNDRHHLSLAARPDCRERTLTVNGFSKGYAMTGWRLGYIAGPNSLLRHTVKVQEHTVGCASSFAQHGALAALTGSADSVTEMTAEYARRRDRVVSALNSVPGLSCAPPEGAFYALPRVSELGFDGDSFCRWILETAGVVLTPGSAFGPGGEDHLRLSFAAAPEVLDEALSRIVTATASLVACSAH